jgi:hypothetical protein
VRRTFLDSPAQPHPSNQYTGLAESGMHADEMMGGSSACKRKLRL